MYEFAVDRIHILQDYARRHCQTPGCGDADDEGVVACSGAGCGEKRIHRDHRRELMVMRDLKALVEGLERRELEAAAAEDRAQKGKRR